METVTKPRINSSPDILIPNIDILLSTVLFEIPISSLILGTVNPLSTRNISWSSDTLKGGRPLRPVNERSALYVGTLDCCALDKHAMADPIPATIESGNSPEFIRPYLYGLGYPSLRGRRTKGRERGSWMRARSATRAPNDRASRSRRPSRSHSTSPLPPLCTPATQATGTRDNPSSRDNFIERFKCSVIRLF